MSTNGYRPGPEPTPGRLVIDLTTATGSLSRDDIRRLTQQLEAQVAAQEQQQSAQAGWSGQGASPYPQSGAYPQPAASPYQQSPYPSGPYQQPANPYPQAAAPYQQPAASPYQQPSGAYPTGGYPQAPAAPSPSPYPQDPYRTGQWDPRGQWDQQGQWNGAPGAGPAPQPTPAGWDQGAGWDGAGRGPTPTQVIGHTAPARSDTGAQRIARSSGARTESRSESRSEGRSESRSGGRPAGRSGSSRSSGRSRQAPKPTKTKSRSPLLVRTTIVVGLIAALAASVSRAGQDATQNVQVTRGTTTGNVAGTTAVSGTMARSGNNAQQPVGRRTAAPIVPAPANAALGTTAGDAGTTDGTTAVSACKVAYSITPQNADKYNVVMMITNTSKATLNGWTLHWDFPATQKIVYGWNAMVTNGPGGASATGIGMDQRVDPGKSVTIGFAGQRGAFVPTPTAFTLNGQTCQWKPGVTAN